MACASVCSCVVPARNRTRFFLCIGTASACNAELAMLNARHVFERAYLVLHSIRTRDKTVDISVEDLIELYRHMSYIYVTHTK